MKRMLIFGLLALLCATSMSFKAIDKKENTPISIWEGINLEAGTSLINMNIDNKEEIVFQRYCSPWQLTQEYCLDSGVIVRKYERTCYEMPEGPGLPGEEYPDAMFVFIYPA